MWCSGFSLHSPRQRSVGLFYLFQAQGRGCGCVCFCITTLVPPFRGAGRMSPSPLRTHPFRPFPRAAFAPASPPSPQPRLQMAALPTPVTGTTSGRALSCAPITLPCPGPAWFVNKCAIILFTLHPEIFRLFLINKFLRGSIISPKLVPSISISLASDFDFKPQDFKTRIISPPQYKHTTRPLRASSPGLREVSRGPQPSGVCTPPADLEVDLRGEGGGVV